MSLILDALRKMEQERKSRRGAAKDLRPEVLRYRGTAEPKPDTKPYLMAAAGLILLVAGAGAGFLLKGNHGGKPEMAAESPPVAATATVATAAAPAAPIPRFEPAAPPAPAAPDAPAPAVSTMPKASASAVVQPTAAAAEISDAEAAVPAPKPSRSARGRRRQEAKAATGEMSGTVNRRSAVSSQAPGDIALSGIAWQDERPMRRAVLNGSLVGEGAMVAGARVVEIKENKVRLSRGGQQFEIALSAALSSR